MKSGIKEVTEAYAKKVGCSKADAEKSVKALVEVLKDEIVTNGGVGFVGLFSIEVVQRAQKTGFNPKTKQPITIPAQKSLKFKIGKTLKEAIQ